MAPDLRGYQQCRRLAEMGFRNNQTRGKPRLRSWDTFHEVKLGGERVRHG